MAEATRGYSEISPFFLRSSPLANTGFEPSEELMQYVVRETRVLIIGAGGLGCELLKNLAMLGIKSIDIIDLDKIDITNLNRQFLFRAKDVGKYKSEVAAEFVRKRCPGIEIKAHIGKIQDFKRSFYEQFQVFIAGLDNIEARRWLNSLIYSFVEFDKDNCVKPESLKVLIDGGTESFGGQSRLVIPGATPCFECNIDTIAESKVYNFCTITHTPRIPEHCIAYAFLIEWDKSYPNKNYDTDSVEDMTWIYETALKRAQSFGIEGVTYHKTLGVVKNIIPNIASTNAIIAASCAHEFLKFVSYIAPTVDNYMMYMGKNSINIEALKFDPNQACIVCQRKPVDYSIDPSKTIEQLVQDISEQFKLDRVTLVTNTSQYLHAANPPELFEAHKHKLNWTVQEAVDKKLLGCGQEIIVFSKTINNEIILRPSFVNNN